MSEASAPTSETTETETSSTEDGSGGGDGKQTKGLQQALAAERKQRQELAAKLAAIEAAQQKAAEEAAAKRGEYEQLYGTAKTELEATQAELAQYKTKEAERLERLTASNAEALKALPENMRALVPSSMGPEEAAEQIRKLAAIVQRDTPRGGVFGNPGMKEKSDEIPAKYRDQAAKEATRYDMDPKRYWALRMKPRLERQGKLKG